MYSIFFIQPYHNIIIDSIIIRDPTNDGRKCSYSDKRHRVFDLRGGKAQESACKAQCAEIDNCVAFSGIWNSWCIGCEIALDDSFNEDHRGAIAFKKYGKMTKCLNLFTTSCALTP